MARFRFYKGLSPRDKKIYDQSDRVVALPLDQVDKFQEGLHRLEAILAKGDHQGTQVMTTWFVDALCTVFRVPRVHVKVLVRRPHNDYGELHGLYEGARGPSTPAIITVWMRTAKREDVVAFKTFLRTVIHEVMHHLDYTHLHLADSFHTEGFYKRESSITRQLMTSPLSY